MLFRSGQTLFAVKRSSTFQLTGFATTSAGSQVLTGTAGTATGTYSGASAVTINVGDTAATFTVNAGHTLTYGMYTTNLGGGLGALGTCWIVGTPGATSITVGFLPSTVSVAATNPTGSFVTSTTRFQDQLKVGLIVQH